jgi:hypothetical protein
MWTVSEATDTAATSASTPSHSAWLAARAKRNAAPMLVTIASAMPQWTAGMSSCLPLFRRNARLIATIRKASSPSRRVITNA